MTTMTISKERQELISGMTPQLRKKIEQLQKLHNDSEHTGLVKRYEFSCIVAEIQRDPETYGNAGMDQIAAWFNISVRNLYYYVSICNTIDRKQFDAIKDKVDVLGYKFTWTHMRALASLDKAGDRNKLVKLWEKESLGSTDFAKRVAELAAAAEPEKGSEDEAAPRRANENAVRSLLKQIISAEERMRTVEGSDLSDFLAVEKKKELLEKLLTECGNLEQLLTNLRKRISELQSSAVADEPFDTTAEDDEPAEIDDLLDDLEAESSDDDTMQSVVDNVLSTPAPMGKAGRKRKAGLPGSKTAKTVAAKAEKAKAKKAKPRGKPTGPAARRRRGEAATV